MEPGKISVLSKRTVRPSSRKTGGGITQRIYLTSWDLRMLPVHYIQKGLLFHNPQQKPTRLVVSDLLTSFSHALDRFYPLAGRLSTTHHDDGSTSISLNCTDEGADFVHASAHDVTVSDVIAATSHYVPPVVQSFFPLNGVINHDGHSRPLLGAQVTELADGIFVACSLNHSVGDGSSFWLFFNSWSHLCRAGSDANLRSPALDRWFPSSCRPPLRLPFKDHREFIERAPLRPVHECAFNFPARSIAKLKGRANEEAGSAGGGISSLQALLAHVWRSITRARALRPEQSTTCMLFVGYRARLRPPLPAAYLGNAVLGVPAKALAGELERKGLGWAAWLVNRTVAAQTEGAAREWVEGWGREPSFVGFGQFGPADVSLSSSPRFDVYGNDFGWGRPAAARSGPGNKVEGKLTVYPWTEEGGMTLEVCLKAGELKALLDDGEFMEAVA